MSELEITNYILPIIATKTLIQITGFSIGLYLARAFGKQADQDIQKGGWFKKLSKTKQNLTRRLLDFLHHFYVGWIIMIVTTPENVLYWFGYGIFVDDIPDIPRRFQRYFNVAGLFESNDDKKEG